MRIDFQCSGGFANLQLSFHADTEDLPSAVADELIGQVEAANYFALEPEAVAPTPKGPPDVVHYQLSLSDGARKRALSCTDVTAPAALRPLLSRLRNLAMEQRR